MINSTYPPKEKTKGLISNKSIHLADWLKHYRTSCLKKDVIDTK